jgi:acrylyl-CoA reductase (NADPH)
MLSRENAMVVGTAGLTAMLSMMALQDAGLNPSRGEVIVTGASGGVGSLAVALLSVSGYSVVASSGSSSAHKYLRDLGAARIIDRGELAAGPGRPLDSARWAGGIDVVGGSTLAAIISQLDRHGSVAACGLAGGHEICTTVYPFILRGVNLLGIDSNTCPIERRVEAWDQIAHLLSPDVLSRIKAGTIAMEEIPTYSERILAGGITGRVVVDVHR